jgi:hypothetical protein
MKCPRCGNRELWIFVRFSGYVLCSSDFTDEVQISQSASMNSDWDDESPCRCETCHWTGTVERVRENHSLSSATAVRARNKVSSLAEVKRRLADQPCPVIWSDCIRYLLARVQASEAGTRQSPSSRNGKSGCDDTAIM